MSKNKRTILVCALLLVLVSIGAMAVTVSAVSRGMPTSLTPAEFSQYPVAPATMLVCGAVFGALLSVLRRAVPREKKLLRGILAYCIVCSVLAVFAAAGMWIYGACPP